MAVTLSQTTATLYAGYRLRIYALDTLSNGGSIIWSTSDSSSITVITEIYGSPNFNAPQYSTVGLITCLIGKGNITITATSSIDGSSATCVVTGYGISIGKVGKMLGMSSTSLGTLCSSNKINKWSLYKPVRKNVVSGPNNIWNSGSFFKYGNYLRSNDKNSMDSAGINIELIGLNDTLNDIINNIDEGSNKYQYYPPSGTSVTPYRLGDFRGYTSQIPEIELVYDSTKDAIENYFWDNSAGERLKLYENWDTFHCNLNELCVKFSDMWLNDSGTETLNDYYVTVIVKTYNDNYFIKSLFQLSYILKPEFNQQFAEVNQSLDFLSVFNKNNLYNNISMFRYYFLTKSNISTTIDITSSINNTVGNISSVSLDKSFYLPLMKYNSKLWAPTNNVTTKAFLKMTTINNTNTSHQLAIGLLQVPYTSYQEVVWNRNYPYNDIEYSYLSNGSGINEKIVGINNIIPGVKYRVLMAIESSDCYLYWNDEPIANAINSDMALWEEIGSHIYNGVSGTMWRWGTPEGFVIPANKTGECNLKLYIGTPVHYLTISSANTNNSSFLLTVHFQNENYQTISEHEIEGNGGSLRFRIPADGTYMDIFAQFTSVYEGISPNYDTSMEVTLAGNDTTSVTLDVKILLPVENTEHFITIFGSSL